MKVITWTGASKRQARGLARNPDRGVEYLTPEQWSQSRLGEGWNAMVEAYVRAMPP